MFNFKKKMKNKRFIVLFCCINDAKCWIMLFMHRNKLEVEMGFRRVKILIVQNFS
jgi:hypothetical protein